jgi:hypothetical protein
MSPPLRRTSKTSFGLSGPSQPAPDTASMSGPFLPPLNKHGFLPEGIHNASFGEVERQFATNPIRKICWQRLLTFLREGTKGKGFSHAHLGGNFISAAPSPADVEVILQTCAAFGPEAFQAIEPFFAQGLDAIYRKHGVRLHFWCEGFPNDFSDSRKIFRSPEPDPASSSESPGEHDRGIVRIALG